LRRNGREEDKQLPTFENCNAVAAPFHLVALDYFPEANIISFNYASLMMKVSCLS
jgi:hypothetical protein